MGEKEKENNCHRGRQERGQGGWDIGGSKCALMKCFVHSMHGTQLKLFMSWLFN